MKLIVRDLLPKNLTLLDQSKMVCGW